MLLEAFFAVREAAARQVQESGRRVRLNEPRVPKARRVQSVNVRCEDPNAIENAYRQMRIIYE